MRRIIFLIVFLCLLPVSASATAFTASVTGDWTNTATWGGLGPPGNGDTVTINAGITVTVSTTVTVGASGATGTAAIVISGSGGILTIAAGGVLNLRGDIQYNQATTININGTLNFDPPAASTYKIIEENNSGSGQPTLNIVGTAGNEAILTTTARGGGNGYIDNNGVTNGPLQLTYAKISNCGSASQLCITYNIPPAGVSVNADHAQFINYGGMDIRISTTSNFVWDQIDFRNCLSTVCHSFSGNADIVSGTRLMTNLTYSNTTFSSMVFAVRDLKIGKSILGGDATDTPGIIAFNTFLQSSIVNHRNVISSSFFVDTTGGAGSNCVVTGSNGSLIFQDSICYSHVDNPHQFSSGSTNVGLTANTVRRNICDGDGYFLTDGGDWVTSFFSVSVLNNILINECGTLATAGTSGVSYIIKNNTSYQSYGVSIGETVGGASQISIFRNNLLVKPSSASGPIDNDGLHQQANYVRQTSFSMDYNAFWQMPGSGDPGAGSALVPAILTNPALGVPGYLNFPKSVAVATKTATAGTTTTEIDCSTCNFTTSGVIAGDYVLNSTRSNKYAIVSTVNSATKLTLATAIAGQVSGDSFLVYVSYWSTAGFKYGDADRGSHDLHLIPNFKDQTRTIATWDSLNAGPGTIADVGAQIVKLNGYDSAGNSASFNALFGVAGALNYIRTGFTPTNLTLKGAGAPADGSPDIGAVSVQIPNFNPLATQYKPSLDCIAGDYPNNIWITDGMTKLHQDSGSYVAGPCASMYAARNEFESFQIHEHNGTGSGIVVNSITVSDLTNVQTGTTIPAATNILVYREGYINITQVSNGCSACSTGLTPDALIPTTDPYYSQVRNAFPFTIAAGNNQSFWIDVLVPPGTASGYYSGTATVANGGSTYAVLPVLIAVWDFSLPSTPTLVTDYGTEGGFAICDQQYGGYAPCNVFPGAGGSSDTALELTGEDTAKMMLDHRITTNTNAVAPPTNDFTHFDSIYATLLNGTAATLLSGARLTNFHYYPDDRLANSTLVQNWASHFVTQGWFDRLIFQVCDEPPAGCNWTDIPTWAAIPQGATPPIPTMVTTSLSKATTNGVLSSINMLDVADYNMDTSDQGGSNTRPTYNSWIAGGGTLHWYISDGQDPQPQYWIDAVPVRNRVFEWLTYLYNISGELYFDTEYCSTHTLTQCGGSGATLNDPWVNQRAFAQNGNGTLIYPGTTAKIGGTTPISIPSIRIKLIRDGMEDYEYLHILSTLGQSAFAITTANTFVTNLFTFSTTSNALQTARIALGNQIHATELGPSVLPAAPTKLSILLMAGTR